MAKLGQMTSWFDGSRRAAAALLLGWVALIVIGAGQRPGNSDRFTLPDMRNVVTAFMVVLFVTGLVLLPFILSSQRGGPRQPRRTQSLRSLIPLFLLAVLLAYALDLQSFGDSTEGQQVDGQVDARTEETSTFTRPDGGSAAILLLACVGAGAVFLWTRWRLAATLRTGSEPPLEAGIASGIGLAADHLLRGTDPRASVLAAYASLEASLAEQGHGRVPSETPSEHLRRALAEVPEVGGPAVKLGELYEIARFSDIPITSEDQRLAASELDRARRQLIASLSGSWL